VRRLFAATGALAVLATAHSAGAQRDTILTYSEVTRSGAVHPIEGRTRAVDVNSTIRIGVDREALRRVTGAASLPQHFTDDVATLTQALAGAGEAVTAMAAAERAYAANPTEPNRIALLDALSVLGPRALAIARLAPEGSPFRAQLNWALRAAGRDPVAQYTAVFNTAAEYVNTLQQDAESFAAQNGVRVRMGAWIVGDQGSREVHLPGFDTVQTQAPNVLPTFQILLTADQVTQLRALGDQARTLRTQTGATPLADVTDVRDRLRAVAAEGLQCVDSVRGKLAAFQAQGQPVKEATDSLLAAWRTLRARYAGGATPAADLATTGPADAAAAWNAAQAWLTAVDALQKRTATSTEAAVNDARTSLLGCAGQVRTRAAGDLAPLVSSFASQAARRLATESLEFSDRVLALDVAQVPEQTELALVTAGPRSPGDQVAFRMSLVDAHKQERVVASQSYAVERAEPFIHLTVAMVWAHRDPPKDASGQPRGNEWHPAPGYSILAKRFLGGGRLARRYPLYGEVLNPGIGLNLSAPDFNLDDTPEFAAGVVLSVFRDYVQAGYSYNFQRSQWFPFIGIRLPLPSATLPVSENTTPSS
jgi:hypothetical protein